MSVGRSDLAYAPDRNDNAYAIGGLDHSGQPLASAERYNANSNTWAAIASLPTAIYHFPDVFHRTNYIYIFGGRTDTASGTEATTVLRYSVSANSWTAMAPMPIAVSGSTAALGADGKIQSRSQFMGDFNASARRLERLRHGCGQPGPPDSDGWQGYRWQRRQRRLAQSAIERARQRAGVHIAPSLPVTYQVPYVFSISATGDPQPTYLVLCGPEGMQVDPHSGAITWTPQADQIGTNSVTVRATNYAGFADWNFDLTVSNPRRRFLPIWQLSARPKTR